MTTLKQRRTANPTGQPPMMHEFGGNHQFWNSPSKNRSALRGSKKSSSNSSWSSWIRSLGSMSKTIKYYRNTLKMYYRKMWNLPHRGRPSKKSSHKMQNALLLIGSVFALLLLWKGLTGIMSWMGYYLFGIGRVMNNTVEDHTKHLEISTSVMNANDQKLMMQHIEMIKEQSFENNMVALESNVYEVTQQYCLPYFDPSFKLNDQKHGLIKLDTELTVLINLLTKSHMHLELEPLIATPHNIILENSGRISFVEKQDWDANHRGKSSEGTECPLLTYLFRQILEHRLEDHLNTELNMDNDNADAESSSNVSSEELMDKVDDKKGTMKRDVYRLVNEVSSVLEDSCPEVTMFLSPHSRGSNLLLTPAMKELFRSMISELNHQSAMDVPLWINQKGRLFDRKIPSQKRNRRIKCNELSESINALAKDIGRDRMITASLSLLARLHNTADHSDIQELVWDHQRDIQQSNSDGSKTDQIMEPRLQSEMEELVESIIDHSIHHKVMFMEKRITEATNKYCVPYFNHGFTLDEHGLTQLDSELAILVDLLTHGTVSIDLTSLMESPHTIILESNGKISFVDTAEWKRDHKDDFEAGTECPLLSHFYSLLLKHKFDNPRMNNDDGKAVFNGDQIKRKPPKMMSAAQFMSKIDDNQGQIKEDVYSIVSEISSSLKESCPSAVKSLSPGYDSEQYTIPLTKKMKELVKSIISQINSGDITMHTPLYIGVNGRMIPAHNNKLDYTMTLRCDELSNALNQLSKRIGEERMITASLSLLARLLNASDNSGTAQLVYDHTTDAPKKTKQPQSSSRLPPNKQSPLKSSNNKINESKNNKTIQKKTPVNKMTVSEVADMVGKLTDEHTMQKFKENGVSGELLASLSDDVLKNEFGITNWGHRQTLLKHFR